MTEFVKDYLDGKIKTLPKEDTRKRCPKCDRPLLESGVPGQCAQDHFPHLSIL